MYSLIPSEFLEDGDVRLADGANFTEGRVEIFAEGQWGKLCADSTWDDREAAVVCRQLLLGDVKFANVTFGPDDGPIFSVNVECTGEEGGLSYCRHYGMTVVNECSQENEIGVVCHDPPSKIPF